MVAVELPVGGRIESSRRSISYISGWSMAGQGGSTVPFKGEPRGQLVGGEVEMNRDE